MDKGQDTGAEMAAATVVGGNAPEGGVGIVAKDHIVVQSKEEAHRSQCVCLLSLIPFFGNLQCPRYAPENSWARLPLLLHFSPRFSHRRIDVTA